MYERLQGKELETENMAKACQDFLFLFFFFSLSAVLSQTCWDLGFISKL